MAFIWASPCDGDVSKRSNAIDLHLTREFSFQNSFLEFIITIFLLLIFSYILLV